MVHSKVERVYFYSVLVCETNSTRENNGTSGSFHQHEKCERSTNFSSNSRVA